MLWTPGSLLALALAASAGLAAPREDVESLVREAEDLAHSEAFAPAAAKLETALRAAERLGDPALTALCLDRMGMVLDFEGDSAAGSERHARALALAREIGDASLEASILASIGAGQFRRSDYGAALASLGEALALQEQIGDDAGRARTLDFIGRVHFKKAAYGQARESYVLALTILDATGDRRWKSIVLEDLGDLDQEQGFYADALAGYEAALRAREEIGDEPGQVYVLHLIGRCYMLQGANREALAWFGRALERAREIGDEPGRAMALYHMGIALYRQGSAGEALARYGEALAIKVRLSDRRQQAWILARMGDANASLKKWEAALARYHRATAIWQEIQDPRGVASGLDKAGLAYYRLGHHAEALAALERSAAILEVGQPAFLAPTLALIGRVHAARGDEARALAYGGRAIGLARALGNEEVLWAVAHRWGSIQRDLGRREEALESLDESLAAIERLRARVVASDEARTGFLEGKQVVYADAIDLLMELGRIEEALELAERARARAFLDLLGGRELAGLATHEPLTLTQIRREVSRRETTLVEYFCSDQRLYVWSVEPDGQIHGSSAPISRRELSRLAERARGARDEARAALRKLHRILIGPVASRLPAGPDRLVTIVPHGPLFLVSFAALLGGDGKYLVDRHTLAYSPAIGVLRYTENKRRGAAEGDSRGLLVVGNPSMPVSPGGRRPLSPLPAAEAEARAIGRLYPAGRVTALTGSRAREETFRELAPGETIIHLATHAVVYDDEPLSSFLALAPSKESGAGWLASERDGLLTVREVFDLDLRASLVTLSACSTGLGLVNGDGVLGLSRAFLYAGTPSVLVSLWRVADPVARFQMERFYRALIETGGDKAAALAGAQRETIARLRAGKIQTPSGRALSEDPLLWAPFILVGEAH
ncbi:MAG: CHAT domain-containing tetratricopeptide repeat protein [Thermoanaerobaculia bacterium]